MTIENKNTVITPTTKSANFDALQVIDFDTDRVSKYNPVPFDGSNSTITVHDLSDDAEVFRLQYYTSGNVSDKRLYIQRVSDISEFLPVKAWAFLPGDYVEGCVKGKRKLLGSKPIDHVDL